MRKKEKKYQDHQDDTAIAAAAANVKFGHCINGEIKSTWEWTTDSVQQSGNDNNVETMHGAIQC